MLKRIFSYAGAVDRLIVVTSCFAAFGSGLTMPLMYILFGKVYHSCFEGKVWKFSTVWGFCADL